MDDSWFYDSDEQNKALLNSQKLSETVHSNHQWAKMLEEREMQHAQELESLSTQASSAFADLQAQYDTTLIAVTAEASEQARLAAQSHALEKQELMQRLMDAAFEQQQHTHTLAIEAARRQKVITATASLGALLVKAHLRQKALALKQWVLATRCPMWANAGRKAAGSWFLSTTRDRRRARDVFQAWKTYTAMSALGYDPTPLNPTAPVTPASGGKLLRHMHAYLAAQGAGRLVRLSEAGEASHTPHVLLGMVFAGLSATQYASLQPSLLEAIYGASDINPSRHIPRQTKTAASLPVSGKSTATKAISKGSPSQLSGESSIPDLYSMAKHKPWRQRATWGAVGASLAAEGRHVHDKEWQLKRRRTKQALNRKYGQHPSSLVQIEFEPHALPAESNQLQLPKVAGAAADESGGSDGDSLSPVVSASAATSKTYYDTLTAVPKRLGLKLRCGGNAAVLFMEASRVVAVNKLRFLMHRRINQQLSSCWRQWVAAVNMPVNTAAAGTKVPVGLTGSRAAFTGIQARCTELEAAARNASNEMTRVLQELEALQKENTELESIAGESLLQLADAQASAHTAKAAQLQLQAANTALTAQMQELQDKLSTTQRTLANLQESVSTQRSAPTDTTQEPHSDKRRLQALNSRTASMTPLSDRPSVSAPRGRQRPAAASGTAQGGFLGQSARWAGTGGGRLSKPATNNEDAAQHPQRSASRAAPRISVGLRPTAEPPAAPMGSSSSASASRRSSFSSMLKQLQQK